MNDTSDNNESVEKFESILSVLLQTLTELIKESQSKIQPKVKLDVKETKSTGGIRQRKIRRPDPKELARQHGRLARSRLGMPAR